MKQNRINNLNKKDLKHKVLSKFTRGRTRAIKKRKKTLLLEYKSLNKSNKFIDRRIGEKDRNMTSEDRIMARFIAQRVKSQNKKKMFNLDSDEVLTHHGRTLEDIEKFDNPQSDDSDDDDGKLQADFVKESHFGGGLFTKVSSDKSSHLNNIDLLIAESKKKKAERQQIKEETQNLTVQLDKNLKELLPVFPNSKTNDISTPTDYKKNLESYDILVRELKFEQVGRPSNKIKSENQIVTEETKRLKKLEEEKLNRMKKFSEYGKEEEEPTVQKKQSADDLDDGLDLDIFDEDEGEDDEIEDSENENSVNDDDDDYMDVDNDNDNVRKTKSVNLKIEKKLPNEKSTKCIGTLANLVKILGDNDVDEKINIITNLLKAQQIHTGISNKENLFSFFNVLLEYIDALFESNVVKESWILASKLGPTLFELTQICGDSAAQAMYDKIERKRNRFSETSKSEATPDMIILLKLVPILFPTSDYYHPVATPSTVFLCHILSRISCKTLRNISTGLFLSTVMLEYISLSNRYCPEVINFLRCVLYVAAPNYEDTIPPVNSKNKILSLIDDHRDDNILNEDLKLSYTFVSSEIPETDETKLKLIYTTLKLLLAYSNHYCDFFASYAIWSPILHLLNELPVEKYPNVITNEITPLTTKIKLVCGRPLEYLTAERKRPKALRLYEPNIRPVIEGKSFRTVSQAKLEKDKLVHQYKREMKGALREIRKDKNFLAQVKLSEQAKKDAERKERVNKILNWGQNQQSDFKRMERQNRFRR